MFVLDQGEADMGVSAGPKTDAGAHCDLGPVEQDRA